MIDGHVHATAALLPCLRAVRCIANADCPAEYAFLRGAGLTVSAGVHPWKADSTSWSDMEPLLKQAAVIGEIGLDSVWCNVDMTVQRWVFRRQLDLAAKLHKPIILHTKGMEREVLATIRRYPNRYLVHWYSCGEHLREYVEQGCWFTVGPQLTDPAVRAVAEQVPLERLLIESDGLEGLAWGVGRTLRATDYPAVMEEHLRSVATLRGLSPDALLGQMERNLDEFLGQKR